MAFSIISYFYGSFLILRSHNTAQFSSVTVDLIDFFTIWWRHKNTVSPLINYHHQLIKKMISVEKMQYRSKLVAGSCMIISDAIFVQEKQWPNLFFNRKSALGILASFQDTTTYIFGKLRLVLFRGMSQLLSFLIPFSFLSWTVAPCNLFYKCRCSSYFWDARWKQTFMSLSKDWSTRNVWPVLTFTFCKYTFKYTFIFKQV